MNKELYLLTIKRNFKSFVIWNVIIILLSVFILALFSSMAEMGGAMEDMIEGLPEGMTKAFGMTTETYTNVLGYFSTYYGMHIMICLGIYASMLGADLLAKEERTKTAEMLFTFPIKRSTIVSSKMMAYLTLVLVTCGLQIVASAITIQSVTVDPVNWSSFGVIVTYGTVLTLLHGALSWPISVLPKGGKSVTGIIIGIVVGSYILDAISKISSDVSVVGYFTTFHYADFNILTADYSLDPLKVIGMLGCALLAHLSCFWIVKAKDYHI